MFARYRRRLCTNTGNDERPVPTHRRRAQRQPMARIGVEAGRPRAAAEILILAVHEEALVKACESLEDASPNQQAGAGNPVRASGVA